MVGERWMIIGQLQGEVCCDSSLQVKLERSLSSGEDTTKTKATACFAVGVAAVDVAAVVAAVAAQPGSSAEAAAAGAVVEAAVEAAAGATAAAAGVAEAAAGAVAAVVAGVAEAVEEAEEEQAGQNKSSSSLTDMPASSSPRRAKATTCW